MTIFSFAVDWTSDLLYVIVHRPPDSSATRSLVIADPVRGTTRTLVSPLLSANELVLWPSRGYDLDCVLKDFASVQ